MACRTQEEGGEVMSSPRKRRFVGTYGGHLSIGGSARRGVRVCEKSSFQAPSMMACVKGKIVTPPSKRIAFDTASTSTCQLRSADNVRIALQRRAAGAIEDFRWNDNCDFSYDKSINSRTSVTDKCLAAWGTRDRLFSLLSAFYLPIYLTSPASESGVEMLAATINAVSVLYVAYLARAKKSAPAMAYGKSRLACNRHRMSHKCAA